MKLLEVNFTYHSLPVLFSLISYIFGKLDKSDVARRDMTFIPYSITSAVAFINIFLVEVQHLF